MAGRVAPRVRLAGHGVDRLGRAVTWTIADGERGRRWRELAANPAAAETAEGAAGTADGAPGGADPPGGLAHAVTMETGHAGQWLRLEVAAPAGLLSLHPERDGSINGNVVSEAGVRHVALGVVQPALVDVRDSLAAETALCRALERIVAAGEGSVVTVVQVASSLVVAVVELAVRRLNPRTWELTDADGIRTVTMGDRGAPVAGDSSVSWPLETGS
jgi:hypothetical protein